MDCKGNQWILRDREMSGIGVHKVKFEELKIRKID